MDRFARAADWLEGAIGQPWPKSPEIGADAFAADAAPTAALLVKFGDMVSPPRWRELPRGNMRRGEMNPAGRQAPRARRRRVRGRSALGDHPGAAGARRNLADAPRRDRPLPSMLHRPPGRALCSVGAGGSTAAILPCRSRAFAPFGCSPRNQKSHDKIHRGNTRQEAGDHLTPHAASRRRGPGPSGHRDHGAASWGACLHLEN